MIKYLSLIIVFIFLMSFSAYATITNPYTVDYLKAEIVQSGEIDTTGRVQDIEMFLSIPQEDEYQKIESITSDQKFTYYTDEFGNKLVKIVWENPQAVNKFEVKAIVTVRRREDVNINKLPKFLEPTDLVESTAPEISALTKSFTGNDFEKISSAAKWVHENVKYDMLYADVNKSALWTLNTKKGVCDEFSMLTLAFARNMGYYSAYVAGYAYTKNGNSQEGFVSHGWTEINDMPVDSTWAQGGFVDATHIKFAELQDASYTQAAVNAKGLGAFKVDLKSVNTNIKVLESTEKPLIISKSVLLDDIIYSGYAVIKSEMTTDKCLLTKIKINSCIDSTGIEMFDVIEPEKVFYFCNQKNVFSILKLKSAGSALNLYKCPIVVTPYGANSETSAVKISYESNKQIDLIVDKTVLTPGESYTVKALGAKIFTDNGDYGIDSAEFVAPAQNFVVYGYNSGALVTKQMTVIGEKPFDAEISVGDNVEIFVQNLLNKPQTVTVKLGDETQTKLVTNAENFTFAPKTGLIQAKVTSGTFSVTLTGQSEGKEEGFFDKIISFFSNLFKGLF